MSYNLHESKFPFVSRIEFIRSKLSNFSPHVSGVIDSMTTRNSPVSRGLTDSVPRRGYPDHTSGSLYLYQVLSSVFRVSSAPSPAFCPPPPLRQIIPPHDSGIQSAIEACLEPRPSSWDTAVTGGAADPGPELTPAYLERLAAAMTHPDTHAGCPIRFTVTSMHGVSHPYMCEAFRACGFKVSGGRGRWLGCE